MALPFFIRSQSFDLAAEATAALNFGPFPEDTHMLIRSIRFHLSLEDITVPHRVTVFAVNGNKMLTTAQFGDLVALEPLFTINGATGLILLQGPSFAQGVLTVDVPCYVLPSGQYPILNIMVENSLVGSGDVSGFAAPIIDFEYSSDFDVTARTKPF